MAEKKVYGASLGPYIYDDTDALDDRDGDFTDLDRHAIITDGQMIVEQAPSLDNHVVRLIDLYERVTELFTETGTIADSTMVAYANGTFNLFLPKLSDAVRRAINIKNIGSGIVTLMPNADEPTIEIEEETNQPLYPGDCFTVISDDTDWWVI